MRLRKPYKYYVLNPLLRNAVKWSDTTFYDIAKSRVKKILSCSILSLSTMLYKNGGCAALAPAT